MSILLYILLFNNLIIKILLLSTLDTQQVQSYLHQICTNLILSLYSHSIYFIIAIILTNKLLFLLSFILKYRSSLCINFFKRNSLLSLTKFNITKYNSMLTILNELIFYRIGQEYNNYIFIQIFLLFTQQLMPQELIIEVQHYYPFGEIETEGIQQKIFVRKRVQYSNQEDYQKVLQKIGIIKKLKHPIIIPLIHILEEQGSYHLIYQYVPHRFDKYLEKLTNDEIQSLKKKLIFLANYLFQNKIDVNFQSRNVGFTKSFDLKYYIDINFIILQRCQQAIKNKNILQINKIFQNIKIYTDKNQYISKGHFSQKRQNLLLADQTKSNRIRMKKNNQGLKYNNRMYSPPYVQASHFEDRDDSRYTSHQSKYRQKSIWTAKSKEIPKVSTNNTSLLLNTIEEKIQLINKNLKKCSKKLENSDQNISSTLRESAKQKDRNRQKTNDRKLSIEIGHLNSFGKNSMINTDPTHSSVRNYKIVQPPVILENIKQNSQQSQNNLGTGATPGQRKQSIKIRKQSIKQRKQSMKQRKQSIKKLDVNEKLTIAPPPPLLINSQRDQSKVKNRQTSKPKKQPLTKRDFQEIKKNEFESFFNSKQQYVQEFLGVLDDSKQESNKQFVLKTINNDQQSQKTIKQTKQQKYNYERPSKLIIEKQAYLEKNKNLKERSSNKMSESNTATPKSLLKNRPIIDQTSRQKVIRANKSNPPIEQSLYNTSNKNSRKQERNSNLMFQSTPTTQYNSKMSAQTTPQTSIQNIPAVGSEKDLKKQQKAELKTRISKVLQKCDLAFQNYRKLTVNPVNVQFLKK